MLLKQMIVSHLSEQACRLRGLQVFQVLKIFSSILATRGQSLMDVLYDFILYNLMCDFVFAVL
jgi:hypothetical protein